jgi:hypothetical protein
MLKKEYTDKRQSYGMILFTKHAKLNCDDGSRVVVKLCGGQTE